MRIKSKYISVYEIEKLLNSNDLHKIVTEKEKDLKLKYKLEDLLDNIESYIYGYFKLPLTMDEVYYLIKILERYINDVVIPLSKKDILFLVKSRICNILLRCKRGDNPNINPDIFEYLIAFPFNNLNNLYLSNKENIKNKLKIENKISSYVKYYTLSNDKEFILDIFMFSNDLTKRKLLYTKELLDIFYITNIPYNYLKDESVLTTLLELEANVGEMEYLNELSIQTEPFKTIKNALINMKSESKIKLLNNPKFTPQNVFSLIMLAKTLDPANLLELNPRNFKEFTKDEYIKLIENLSPEEIRVLIRKHSLTSFQKAAIINASLNERRSHKFTLYIIDNYHEYITKETIKHYITSLTNYVEAKTLITKEKILNKLNIYEVIHILKNINISEELKIKILKSKRIHALLMEDEINSFDKIYIAKINEYTKKLTNSLYKDDVVNLLNSVIFLDKKDEMKELITKNIKEVMKTLLLTNEKLELETIYFIFECLVKCYNENVTLKCMDNSYFDSKETIGIHVKKEGKYFIKLNKRHITNNMNDNKKVINTIFLELSHISKFETFEKKHNHLLILKMIKDMLIFKKIKSENLTNNLEYTFISFESDTIIKSMISSIKFFRKLNPNKVVYKHIPLEGKIDLKSIDAFEDYNIDILFDQLFTPEEIVYYAKSYPILLKEYEINGNKKSLVSLFYNRDEIEMKIKRKFTSRPRKSSKNYEIYTNLKSELKLYNELINNKRVFSKSTNILNIDFDYLIKNWEELLNHDFASDSLNRKKYEFLASAISNYNELISKSKVKINDINLNTERIKNIEDVLEKHEYNILG